MEDEEYIEDDLDFDLDEDLDEDEILVPEDEEEELTEDYIYKKLEKRKSPFVNRIIGGSVHDEIVANESGGDYKAENPNSSAVGKYQFLWGTWGDKIRQTTGVRTKEEFKNSPEAQESFYNNYYVPNEMMPSVKKLKLIAPQMSEKQLAKLYHYQGMDRATRYLTGTLPDKVESYNSPISKYIGKSQYGGSPIRPLETGSLKRIPDINMNYPNSKFDRSAPSNYEGLDVDLNGILSGAKQVYDTGKKYAGQVAEGLSQGIDVAEQFTSEQNKNEQYRKMMQRLNGDNPSNYSPSTQRINNNPIL